MEKRESKILKKILLNTKSLINIDIHRALFLLFRNIFIKEKENSEANQTNIEIILDKINSLINNANDKITNEYKKSNFDNILKFVRGQNKIYAGEIIENILIIIFSLAFESNKINTFGKYLYNNIDRFKNTKEKTKEENFGNWFQTDKFKPQELKSITKILEEDVSFDRVIEKELDAYQKENVFYDFLAKIYFEKYKVKRVNPKIRNYFNGEITDEINIGNKNIDSTIYENEISKTYYTAIFNCYYYKRMLGKGDNLSIKLAKSFFIQVFIYYQNSHSPLMEYIHKSKTNEDLAIIPFCYELIGAGIQSQFAGIISSPARVEPRINEINFMQNVLKEEGILELAKILIFNKQIKIIDFSKSALKSSFLDFLSTELKLFNNDSIEELNLSYNYIKEDAEKYLVEIISKLRGLKTINLSSNELKNGLAPFFVMLKNLYREGKTKLENLILNKCVLDDISFYELGEMLKSKYCKLKVLIINMNNIPSNVNFIKKLKKNRSLTEIYFNQCDLGNREADDMMRVINLTNIEDLYLHKNRFNNFNDCLRMLYRTKLILDGQEIQSTVHEDATLYNIDISSNDYLNRNENHIKLIEDLIDKTNLYCIDISHILFGAEPNKTMKDIETNPEKITDYQNAVYKLRDILNNEQGRQIQIMKDIHTSEVTIKRIEKEKKFGEKYPKNIEDEIDLVIEDNNSKYPIFLKERARKIIVDNVNNFQDKNYKEAQKELEEYMTLKKNRKLLAHLKESKSKRKLILI